MENTLLFIFICSTNILVRLLNRKYEEQSYPQKVENVRPHSSNSIENVFSSTSPLASYKAVTLPRPTHPGLILFNQHMFQNNIGA